MQLYAENDSCVYHLPEEEEIDSDEVRMVAGPRIGVPGVQTGAMRFFRRALLQKRFGDIYGKGRIGFQQMELTHARYRDFAVYGIDN